MNRRSFLHQMTTGAALAGAAWGGSNTLRAAQAPEPDPPTSDPLRITRVRAFLTAPGGIRLVVVRVETSEPGLYGLGCGTFTQRARTVVTAVNDYLDPFLRGKNPNHVEDLWQAMFQSSYWRNGPVLMNALSGVDMALWDIKGKRAGMPVYELLGGKCRVGVPVYRHVHAASPEAAADGVRRFMAKGVRHVRVQFSIPGQAAYGARGSSARAGNGHFAGNRFEPRSYRLLIPKYFARLREILGDEIALLHDVHERLHPIQGIGLAKDLEPYHLFFLEDPVAPEDVDYLPKLREQTSTPIAMGELFNNPNEWLNIISSRSIDFIRCHLSQIGGITVGKKLAALCEFFRVRTAWHGPGDLTPIGHAANLHLDTAIWNFGIQELVDFNDATHEVFPGAPRMGAGIVELSDRPGFGVDFNEALAAKHPIRDDPPFDLHWGQLRGADGTIRRP